MQPSGSLHKQLLLNTNWVIVSDVGINLARIVAAEDKSEDRIKEVAYILKHHVQTRH